MEVSIIINVSKNAHIYRRGTLGQFTVPGKKEGEEFGLLVVRAEQDLQDVGSNNQKREKAIKAATLAQDILGYGADSMMYRGLLICSAEPDVPRSLERAEEAERELLDSNPGEVKMKRNQVLKMNEFRTVDEPEIAAKKRELSELVAKERARFEENCRKLVKPEEVAKARTMRVAHMKSLVQEADILWSREETRKDVNNPHKEACTELGLERPWCYDPTEMQDCEGCGGKVKKGVAICQHCNAILDEKKARKLYPDRFAVAKAS